MRATGAAARDLLSSGAIRPLRGLVANAGVISTDVRRASADDRWAHLRDGAYVVIDRVDEQPAFAHDRDREARLWDATGELLKKA